MSDFKSQGKQMAEIHNKWKRSKTPSDFECNVLRSWLQNVADYLRDMDERCTARHVYSEKEYLERIIEDRKKQ